jgi:hypothetical protein
MRMLILGLKRHQVGDVHDTYLNSGRCLRSRSTAAMTSSVGTSPAQAITGPQAVFL